MGHKDQKLDLGVWKENIEEIVNDIQRQDRIMGDSHPNNDEYR